MAAQGFLLIASFLLVLFVLARPLGTALARLINNVPLPGTRNIENVLWRISGISDREMNWRQYLMAILLLNIVGLIALFTLLILQGSLPLNPQQLPGLSWHLAEVAERGFTGVRLPVGVGDKADRRVQCQMPG